jgi:hypothetical protein
MSGIGKNNLERKRDLNDVSLERITGKRGKND